MILLYAEPSESINLGHATFLDSLLSQDDHMIELSSAPGPFQLWTVQESPQDLVNHF